MKKKILKHLLVVPILVVGLVVSFGKTAHGVDEAKLPKATGCCVGGTYTGVSNDCDQGAGGCIDGHCLSGETEIPGGTICL